MRRDMNLVRLLLLDLEGEEDVSAELGQYSERAQAYHRRILMDAGLVDDRSGGDWIMLTWRLTWDGHEFLDAARSESVWNTALKRLRDAGVTVGISVLKPLLIDVAKEKLGLKN